MLNEQYSSSSIRQFLFYLVPAFLLIIGGCVSTGGGIPEKKLKTPVHYKSSIPLVSLFFLPNENDETALSLTLKSVELFDGQQWIATVDSPFIYDSLQKKNDQVLVNRFELNEAVYSKIRLIVSKVELNGETGPNPLSLVSDSVTIDLDVPLRLKRFDRQCLYIVWDRKESLKHTVGSFTPVFRAYSQEITLTSELVYISCPDIDTIYIVRTDTNRVVGSWSVTGRPTYLKAFKDADEIYILAENEHVIKVYELSSGRLKDEIAIPLIVKPGVMVINQAKTNAYLLDKSSDFTYRIDLTTKSYATRVRVGEKPSYAIYLEDQERLAVSSMLSQKIYFLDPTTLETLDIISSGDGPSGMYPYDGKLYVSESRSNSIMMYNFTTGKITRKNVGLEPVRLMEHDGHIFVANSLSETISVVLPDQLTTLKEIRTGGKPNEMTASTNRRWLYAVNGGIGGVIVIDLTTHKLHTSVDLNTKSFDVEIIN